MNLAAREEEERVRDFLDRVSGEKGGRNRQDCGHEAGDKDSFVDIMSGNTADGNAELEGWTFADALACANLYIETLAEGLIDTSQLPKCFSPSFNLL